jgi:hypothetical protein
MQRSEESGLLGRKKRQIDHESTKEPQYDSNYLRGRRKHEKEITKIL